MMKDIMVRMLNKLMLSSPAFPLIINFFDNTFLDWKVIFDPNAAKKPIQLKDSSEVEARATPLMMGTRDKMTVTGGRSPKKIEERRTLKKGSKALTVWVKDTATARKETLVKTLPRTWIPARGVIDFRAPGSIVGRG